MSQNNFIQNFNAMKLNTKMVYETETLTASGASSLEKPITLLDGTAGALAVSLGDGELGLIKTFICIEASNASTITPSTFLGGSTIELATAGESVSLVYTGT